MKLVELQNAYTFGYDSAQEIHACGDAMRLDLDMYYDQSCIQPEEGSFY